MSFTLFDKTSRTSNPNGLNFASIHTVVNGSVGFKDANDPNTTWPYAGEKPGGTDVGHLVEAENSEKYIIKTGITLSLLGRALLKFTQNNPEKEKQFLGIIVGNFTRIAGSDPIDHPELARVLNEKHFNLNKSTFADLLTQELVERMNLFKGTSKGQQLIQKLKNEPLTTNDIYQIYHYLAENPILREVIGLGALADVLNGAYGQYFNNAYQSRVLPPEMLDDHRLLIESNANPALFMASRFNSAAEPFDQFLLKPFLAHDPANIANKALWLAQCKADLLAKISSIQGLGSAILIRLMMGESADLGPDNMLVVAHKNAWHIINIDVTGFRYPRRHQFEDKKTNEVKLGWEKILQSLDNEQLIRSLLNGSVFNARFINTNDQNS